MDRMAERMAKQQIIVPVSNLSLSVDFSVPFPLSANAAAHLFAPTHRHPHPMLLVAFFLQISLFRTVCFVNLFVPKTL